TSAIESRCRRSAGAGGSRSSRITRMSPMDLLLWRRDEQHLVDLVHLDELNLDALLPRGRQVLADVVGTDWKLSVSPVRQAGELDARGAPVVEKRVDRRADRSARVQHVVDEDARAPFEREVEPCGAHERLRMPRRLARPHLDVVAIEGDVKRAQRNFVARELVDPSGGGGGEGRAPPVEPRGRAPGA